MPGHPRPVTSRRRLTQAAERPRGVPPAAHGAAAIGAGVASGSEPQARTRWPAAPHIPRYLVLPSVATEDQQGAIPVVGAHRFRVAPTPVLGASLSLMGIPSVATACRPFRTVAQRYHCARFAPGAHTLPGVSLRTGRFPKV